MHEPIRQSAVIPFREKDGGLQILLITSRTDGRWIVPKGHVEPYLSPAESAAREADEEAGVRGELLDRCVGSYRYSKYGHDRQVDVFLLRVTEVFDDWLEKDERKRRWFSLEKAARKIKNAELVRMIEGLPQEL